MSDTFSNSKPRTARPVAEAPFPSRASADEAALMKNVRIGDETSFCALIERCHGCLTRLAACFARDPSASTRLVQATWGVLSHPSVGAFDGSVALRPFVLRILFEQAERQGLALTRSLDLVRAGCSEEHETHRPSPGAPGPVAGPRLGEERETAEAIERAVAALPGDQRAVIVLRDIEGLSSGEACYVLGIGEPEQRGLLHEARRRVHADIAARLPNGDDEPDESKAEPGRVAWIDTIPPEGARGDLADLYRAVSTSRGAVANVLVAQSLNAQALRAHLDLYRAVIFQGSSLSREARERIGVAVSAANRSLYCVTHHAEALWELGTSTDEVEALVAGETPSTLGAADRALLRWAQRATVDPAACTEEDVAQMRTLGLDDRAILDAALTVAYFSFVNRLVLMLGVEVEIDPAASCRNVHEDSW